MIYKSLKLTNFRSYSEKEITFTEGLNSIVGPNGSGKTNILEAIYFASQGKSFRANDSDMIKHGEEFLRVSALTSGGPRVVKLEHRSGANLKSFVINNSGTSVLSASKKVPVVLFQPEHMRLINGESELRRSFLDEVLSQTKPGYSTLLKDFKKVLAQRNRLLKNERISNDHIFVWNIKFADLSSKVSLKRAELIAELMQSFSAKYELIAGHQQPVKVGLDTKTGIKDPVNSILKHLEANTERDRVLGFTTVGAQRDDLVIEFKHKEASKVASRGETRSIILALKLASADVLEGLYGYKPILLLDDVMGELDDTRQKNLRKLCEEYQAVVTSTK